MRQRAQNSTSYPNQFLLVLSSDHITGATGKTPTVKLSKNGAAGVSASGAVTEVDSTNHPGLYSLAGNATDRNTLGELWAHITATGCDPIDVQLCDVVADDSFATVGAAVWAYIVEGSYTALNFARLFAAALGGKVSGADTSTVVVRDASNTKTRITATTDAFGNRSSVTLDLS